MKDPAQEPGTSARLVEAYNRMMERVRTGFEEAEEKALPKLKENLDKATETAVELEELTREEAERIALYLRRDLEDMGHYLAETGSELGEWLRFDIHQLEERALESLLQVADRTRVEQLALQRELAQDPPYHTGEITGLGTLYCSECGQAVHFHEAGHIPPCPKCHSTNFRRARVAGREAD